MTLRPLRFLVAAIAVLALALPAAGVAAPRDSTIDRGVVQSADSSQIVLRAVDGRTLSLPVSDSTRVKINGGRGSLSDIHPGFVAWVTHEGSAPASIVRAFGQVPLVVDRGTVTALTRSSVTLRTLDGATLTVPIDGGTQVRFVGIPARRFLFRPGAFVTVTHGANGPAKLINVLKRPGA